MTVSTIMNPFFSKKKYAVFLSNRSHLALTSISFVSLLFSCLCLFDFFSPCLAAVLYVSPSGNNTPPFADWNSAASSIQDAIELANEGDTVLVTNGVYETGSTVISSMANRVAIHKPIVLTSVNGPAETVIKGSDQGGEGAVRCAYVGEGAQLVGFTLTSGSTRAYPNQFSEQVGGGAWCEPLAVISNCVIVGNVAFLYGGGIYQGIIKNSRIANNTSFNGGGVYRGLLENCQVFSNTAENKGGGVYGGLLENCQILSNTAKEIGGGVFDAELEGSRLEFNVAGSEGGGASESRLTSCRLKFNRAQKNGGGASYSHLQNCIVASNTAHDQYGGGAFRGTLRSCTVILNSAGHEGGGTWQSTLENCIVYYNTSRFAANFWAPHVSSVSYTCTIPLHEGVGNFTNRPSLTSLVEPRLTAVSPCIDQGRKQDWMVDGVDLDGEARINGEQVDMGADEYHPSVVSEVAPMGISMDYKRAVVGFGIRFLADIRGSVQEYAWHWGDGEVSSNMNHVVHSYSKPGVYNVVLKSKSRFGVMAEMTTVHIVGGYTNYVSKTGSHVKPYDTWKNAATNIQEAIKANHVGGGTVLVADGVYAEGATEVRYMSNRIALLKPLTVRSFSGPKETVIEGAGPMGGTAVRCAYVGNGAMLEGFTLTQGYTDLAGDLEVRQSGGGVWCEPGGVVSNCVITRNSANLGGGTYGGVIKNSLIEGNKASLGGGAYRGSLIDCTLASNTARDGGGASGSALSSTRPSAEDFVLDSSMLLNCTVISNKAVKAGGGVYRCDLTHCRIESNTAGEAGGGVSQCMLQHCFLERNLSERDGGGASESDLQNCMLISNTTRFKGGGTLGGIADSCTLISNTAGGEGGGTWGATILSSIVYYNTARSMANIYLESTNSCDFSCTVPDPGGIGNITDRPGFTSLVEPRLVPSSPCVDRGRNQIWMTTGLDLDQEARIFNDRVDMGADEVHPNAIGGTVSVELSLDYADAIVGFGPQFTADIRGRVNGYEWHWGDGQVSSNVNHLSHSYSEPGDYRVVLRAWREEGSSVTTAAIHVVEGYTNYVSKRGTHVFPYGSWETAATNIQAAIEANNVGGATVMVADGVYSEGKARIRNAFNRIAITKPLIVRSLNGPDATSIVGQGPVGDESIRCAYVGAQATLVGFTLAGGYTKDLGDLEREQSGGGVWCESTGVVSNCIVRDNSAEAQGGGIFGGIVRNSRVENNTAGSGAGASKSEIELCQLMSNSAELEGGGAYRSVVKRSTIESNDAAMGGGTSDCLLQSCTLLSNLAVENGGGAAASELENCSLIENTARQNGGGVFVCTMRNCTLVANEAEFEGGGTWNSSLDNSIVYYNKARFAPNVLLDSQSTCNYSCTIPDPGGIGNITNRPSLSSLTEPRLVASSLCIDRGTNQAWMTTGSDIDEEARVYNQRVDMGTDEVHLGQLDGDISLSIVAETTNALVGFEAKFTADIRGKVVGYAWHWGDGSVSSNIVKTSHAYEHSREYSLMLQAWNNEVRRQTNVLVHVGIGYTNYVSKSGKHIWPYESWEMAATNIQSAIDANPVHGGTVIVDNGTYNTGRVVVNRMLNRISITNSLTVRSLNGPEVTVIEGEESVFDEIPLRCAYVGKGALLEGFTLTKGSTSSEGDIALEQSGGGAWCEATAVVSDCLILRNIATGEGGGVYGGVIQNCRLEINSARLGGGASRSRLEHCIVIYNDALEGGGTYNSRLDQCTLVSNEANEGGGSAKSVLDSCSIISNLVQDVGGGAYQCELEHCTLTSNVAANFGGGAEECRLSNCTVTLNDAHSGGGASGGTLRNCLVYENNATTSGGGASFSILENCTVTSNISGEEGDGTFESALLNCIVYYNGSENVSGGEVRFTCTIPDPGGEGNVTNAPLFLDRSADDYRLQATSPCIDAGVNQDWMLDSVDLSGCPRILNGSVDMGAYEFAFDASFMVFLQGAYNKESRMYTHLQGADLLPYKSPYASDLRRVTQIPPEITDWVLIELREETNTAAVVYRSVFLRMDGEIVSEEGEPVVSLEASAGHYYVVIKHRNHLSLMSAEPVAFTNRIVTYDFSKAGSQNFGGTNGVVEVESGVWAMIVGDADGDGEVLPIDRRVYETQTGVQTPLDTLGIR